MKIEMQLVNHMSSNELAAVIFHRCDELMVDLTINNEELLAKMIAIGFFLVSMLLM